MAYISFVPHLVSVGHSVMAHKYKTFEDHNRARPETVNCPVKLKIWWFYDSVLEIWVSTGGELCLLNFSKARYGPVLNMSEIFLLRTV